MEAATTIKQYTVELDNNGQLTLPADFRTELKLEAGGQLTLVQVEGYWLILPKPLVVLEALDTLNSLMTEVGATFEGLMETGQEIRANLFEEQYGDLVRANAG